MLYKILHFQEISGASVAVFCNECNRSVKKWAILSILCHVLVSVRCAVCCCCFLSTAISQLPFQFISSHTSLPAGVHIDPQRDPVSGRSLRSQANLVVAGITRCNCPFWFIATDPMCVLSRAHYDRKCRWSIYLFTLGLASTITLPVLILEVKQFLWTDV